MEEEEEGEDEENNDEEEEEEVEVYLSHSGEVSMIEENWASVLEDLSHFCVQWLKRLMIQSPGGLTTEQQPYKRIPPSPSVVRIKANPPEVCSWQVAAYQLL